MLYHGKANKPPQKDALSMKMFSTYRKLQLNFYTIPTQKSKNMAFAWLFPGLILA
jgi:hypothetical protein